MYVNKIPKKKNGINHIECTIYMLQTCNHYIFNNV